MCCAIPYPWFAPRLSVWRINISRVPGRKSGSVDRISPIDSRWKSIPRAGTPVKSDPSRYSGPFRNRVRGPCSREIHSAEPKILFRAPPSLGATQKKLTEAVEWRRFHANGPRPSPILYPAAHPPARRNIEHVATAGSRPSSHR